MSRLQMSRVKKMETRVHRPRENRTIYAGRPDYDEQPEGHDSIRAKLCIRPEVGLQDLVMYCLQKGDPPRFKMPRVWQHSIYPPTETVVENGGEIAPPPTT